MKIVIDMMGADQGSVATVAGVLTFHKNHPDVELFCVGRASELQPLNGVAYIIDAPEVLPMTAGAMDVLRAKNSSVMTSITTMINEKADAIVGAGSTGGFLTALTIKLKLIPGVERAAIIAPFPTKIKGKKVAVLDIGASNENTSSQIVQFAKMGRIYAQKVFGVDEPKTYLLANGAEDEKGTPEIKEANHILRETNFPQFMGNIEGREALEGQVDVLVTGGFAGNIFLKTTEGIAKMMSEMIKKAFKRNVFSKIGYIFANKGFKEMRETMDYKSTGGAMLLGINGVAIKAHGNSDAYGFMSAIEVGYKMAEKNVVALMIEGFKQDA
ncbi:MAG TPA: phosphate acyltransferase PlsX [Bacilli bacterium]|nr:phosphate acyltransferase PlsX [Bacilli bacterium]